MNCKKNEKFTVLTFSTVERIWNSLKDEDVNFEQEKIIEVAAVKIKNGKIEKHFSSFVGLEGYDAHDIYFRDWNFNLNKARAEHLIGAPMLREVARTIKAFVGEDTIILRGDGEDEDHPYHIFTRNAQQYGILFDNEIVDIGLIYDAVRLQDKLEDRGLKFEEATPIEVAQMLAPIYDNWKDAFFYSDVDFDPSDDAYMQDRDDPLSWALAFAKFLIKMLELDKKYEWKVYDADDEDIPF